MTRRSYSDLAVTSNAGRLQLEALSPDNGNALSQDGTPLKGSGLGAFQRNFRYRLKRTSGGAIHWERWQPKGEGSPVSAFLSDEGYVVIRAHLLDWGSDELLFIDPKGEKRLVVVIAAENYEDDRRAVSGRPGATTRPSSGPTSTFEPRPLGRYGFPVASRRSLRQRRTPTSAHGLLGVGASSSIWAR